MALGDGFSPLLGYDGMAAIAILIFMGFDTDGWVSVAEAVGENLIEKLILDPLRWLLLQVVAEVLRPCGNIGRDAGTMDPPLFLSLDGLEGIYRQAFFG